MTVQAFFLPSENGQRFCLFHPANQVPDAAPRGQVVYVHPLTEEMNKSRRMAALQSRALAQAGFDVLQIDLLGCGDSSGDFGDATWATWVDDVISACRCLRTRTGKQTTPLPPLWLWGLRAGCLLAAQAAQTLEEPCHFLFWAPSPAGKPILQQFLRLRAAADLASGNAKAVMNGLRSDLAQGRAVEIGGYVLSPDLANGLEQSSLLPPLTSDQASRVEWFELSTRDEVALTPVTVSAIAQWQQAGYEVHSHIVSSPSFWQTTEIEEAPKLIAATTSALMRGG
jgi:exosortase A-associated hydrolase 2